MKCIPGETRPPPREFRRERGRPRSCFCLEGGPSIGFNRHKTSRTNMLQWERDGSCLDHSSSCLSQFYCWLPRRIRQRRRGYASGGIFTTAEADFTTTESTRKQVPCGPGERSRQTHMALGLPPICIRAAIRFVANTPPATRDGVVSSVVVHAISPKKTMVRMASNRCPPEDCFEFLGIDPICVH